MVTEFIQGEKETAFNCIIRLAIFEKEEALKWLKEFEENSLTTWNVDRTYKECTSRRVFKVCDTFLVVVLNIVDTVNAPMFKVFRVCPQLILVFNIFQHLFIL